MVASQGGPASFKLGGPCIHSKSYVMFFIISMIYAVLNVGKQLWQTTGDFVFNGLIGFSDLIRAIQLQ